MRGSRISGGRVKCGFVALQSEKPEFGKLDEGFGFLE